jgi:hypothetical protein
VGVAKGGCDVAVTVVLESIRHSLVGRFAGLDGGLFYVMLAHEVFCRRNHSAYLGVYEAQNMVRTLY